MNLRKCIVLIVVAKFLFLTEPSLAEAALEIDGMSIDISKIEFIKARPEAKSLSIRPEDYQSYFYVPKNYVLNGFVGSTASRIFVKGHGCAASVGFENVSSSKRDELMRALLPPNLKMTGDENFEITNGKLVYFEGSDVFVMIFYEDKNNIKSSRLAYTVSMKSCGLDLARKIQVLPR